ncbi:hypothetical protein KR084_012430 [Drosophila pseudotakahashii]|nr:hypothetical protein KR084_012430 [Drosophila pseudotakahashii]
MENPSTLTVMSLVLVIILSRGTFVNPQLGFLNQLLQKISQEEDVMTLFLLHHHESRSCALHGWHHREIPTLRFDELTIASVRSHFNHHSLSVVCLCKDSDTILLDTLAKDIDRMRQERIILWIQTNVTKELLHIISNQSEEHIFKQLLIVEAIDKPDQEVTALRQHFFPSPHFQRIENICDSEGPIFSSQRNNFMGRTATLEPALSKGIQTYKRLSPNVRIPIDRARDNLVLDFANRYNLRLKVMEPPNGANLSSPRMADFQFNSLFSGNVHIQHINPFDISTITVVVPCGREMRIEEVFQHLDLRSWLLHILLVYGIFVLAETLILVVTHRISGEAYRLTSLSPVLNLRAFRALLGMSFPMSRRSSLSLRQLILVITVFGFVFSNFFSCKLSALLTKHSLHSQVRNFEELQSSGLSVQVDLQMRILIESRLGADFLRHNITRVKFVTQLEKNKHLLSLDSTYAHVLPSEKWHTLRYYQKFYDKKVFCTSKDLTIIRSIPRTYTQQKNSIFYWPFFLFSIRLEEAGIVRHWTERAPFGLRSLLNVTIVDSAEQRVEALSVDHLMWLWTILVCGHGFAIFVFIIEMVLGGHRRWIWNPLPRNNIIVV